MKYLFAVISLFILLGCKTTTSLNSVNQVEKLVKKVKTNPEDIIGVVEQTRRSHQALNQDVTLIKALLKELGIIVGKEWGEDETQLPSLHENT